MKNVMTYYKINDKIMARSYLTSNGYIFEEGTAFDTRDAVSGLRDFFVTKHSCRLSKFDLRKEIELFKRQHRGITPTAFETLQETYR